ncbi:MAG: ABC transporter permease [Hyphomonadaceae bacterium]
MRAAAGQAAAVKRRQVTIRPNRGLFDLDLAGVWAYRDLWLTLVVRDIQVLYKQAALGAAWAVIQPVFAAAVFTIVFGVFAKIPSDGIPYPVFAFAAVLPWTYFSEATRRAATGLVDDADLVRKVYFPRLVMPLARIAAPLLDFAIAFAVLLVVMAFYGVMPSVKLLAIIPLILLTALLALAISLWLAPVNVRYRDVKHTVPFMLQIGMYASPIVYPLSQVPAEWKTLYSLNPMVGVIEGFRWAVFDRGAMDVTALGVSLAVIGAALLGGLVFFRRMERSFADVI